MSDVMDYDYFLQLIKSINSPEINKHKHELFENILYKRIHPDELVLMKIGKTQEYFQEGKILYKKVADLKTGKIFGELALVNRSPRMGTIVVTKNSHLAIMNKDAFDKIFSG